MTEWKRGVKKSRNNKLTFKFMPERNFLESPIVEENLELLSKAESFAEKEDWDNTLKVLDEYQDASGTLSAVGREMEALNRVDDIIKNKILAHASGNGDIPVNLKAILDRAHKIVIEKRGF